MKTSHFLLPALLTAVLGLAACDKKAPMDAPMTPAPAPTMSGTPASATPSAVMPPASGGSAP